MLSIRQINQAISEGIALKFLAQSYSEVAAAKLKRIRSGIEQNRHFLTEIATIYGTIKLVAAQRKLAAKNSRYRFGQALKKLRVGSNPPVESEPKPRRTVKIVITSNYHLYGNLDPLLVEFFMENEGIVPKNPLSVHPPTRPKPIDIEARIIVIGRVGVEFFKLAKTPFEGIIFKSDLPEAGELRSLAGKVKDDDRVLVYYSRLQTVLHQIPFITDIKEAQFEFSVPKKKIDYIFEPEIDKMLLFFDTQISSILLNQTFLEAELARTAARLIAMSNAEENADHFQDVQKRLLGQAKRSLTNIQLLDTVAATFRARKEFFYANK